MKRISSVFALAAVLVSPVVHSQQADAVGSAVNAANQWLALADASDSASTWEQASPSFQAAISKVNWSVALKQARQPLGMVKSRKIASSELKHSRPGAQDGEYVLIQYDTQFEHQTRAVETVVPMRDKDGNWKVSGYFVK
ncbi:DUF4019 domain-containing protein [Massilia timonae]|uniref:DUF4019 domain-containing protein n=1 Tax=Massilia timonae TaxID=47229 RepID=UPI002899C5D6|nr:DUF4019 domain-containing protein [Massilia timonae]